MRTKLLALTALGMLFGVSSCSGCYYARLGVGQAKVLVGRQSIADALDGKVLTDAEKAKLALVPKMRAFAQEKVGLAKTGSYTQFYDTGKDPISWNVTAVEATSFNAYTWHFPFVGDATYKGFFDKEHADEEADRLRAQGYDVVVREVAAYSTLGWFDDPVFRRMLDRDVGDLANTICHELTHATVFRSGDQSFNESVATFIGNEGGLAFLAAEYGPESAEVKAAVDGSADEDTFSQFIDGLYAKLDRLYTSDATVAEKRAGRDKIFAACKVEFEEIRRTRMKDPGAYAWFAKRPLNNALLVGYRHYHTDLSTFSDVLQACGGDFKSAIAVFHDAAEEAHPHQYLAGWAQLARDAKLKKAEGEAVSVHASGS
jgi:predicted aminopeptidase